MNPDVAVFLKNNGVDPDKATPDQIAHAQTLVDVETEMWRRAHTEPVANAFGGSHIPPIPNEGEDPPYTEEDRQRDIDLGFEPTVFVEGIGPVSVRKPEVSPEKEAELRKYAPPTPKFDFSNPSAEQVEKNLEFEKIRRRAGLTRSGGIKPVETPTPDKPFEPFGGTIDIGGKHYMTSALAGAGAKVGAGPGGAGPGGTAAPVDYTPSPEGGVLPPDEYAFYLRSKYDGEMKPADLKRLQGQVAEYRKWYNNQGLPYRINQAEINASKAQAGVEQERLGAQHGLYGEEIASRDAMERRLQDQEHLFAVERQERTKALDEAQANYKSAIDAYDKIKLDPEMGFEAMGGRPLASLAAALGSIGASLTGGPNTAVDLIKYNVDLYMQSQRANMAKAGNAINMKQTLLGILTDRLGDVDKAEIAARGIMFQDLAMSAETLAKRSGDADVIARGKSIAESLKANAEKFKLLTAQQLQAEADAKTQARMSMYASSLAAKRARETPKAKAGKLTEGQAKLHVKWQTWESGKGWVQHEGFARSESQADRIEAMTGHYEAARRNIDKLEELQGYALPGTDTSARANMLKHDTGSHIVRAQQGDSKNMTKSDLEDLAAPYVSGIDGTDLTNFNAPAMRKQLVDLENNDVAILTRGIVPGTIQPMINDKGETEWLGTFETPAEVERKGKPVGEGYTQTNEAPAAPGEVDFSSR